MWPALGIFGPAGEVCIFDPPREATNQRHLIHSLQQVLPVRIPLLIFDNKVTVFKKRRIGSFTNLKPGQFGKAPFGSEAVKSCSQIFTMSPGPSESS